VLPLLNLLRYAYGLRHLEQYAPVEYTSSKWSFQDLLIYQLSLEVSELLARGLHRDYLRIACDLASPRGRINFNRYVTVAHGAKAVLPCVDHPRSVDTLFC
jgi:5-methylcytosine-specific restriction enzyme subunit McrC